jgi:PKHD-type hydroxylase
MAFEALWYFTEMPKKVVDILEEDLKVFEEEMKKSKVGIGQGKYLEEVRNSNNSWIPTDHWISGFIWHYVQKANRENFVYDISSIDSETLQFTKYNVGEFYGWHHDEGLSSSYKPKPTITKDSDLNIENYLKTQCQLVRKLSVSLLLSDPEDYEGGNLELKSLDGDLFIAPRIRGTICIFDSRTLHRVQPITKGVRKSLVAWIVGPRWK